MKNGRKFGISAVVILFLGIFGASFKVDAQAFEIGVTGGLSSYYGDINTMKPFNEAQLGFGGLVRYYQSTRWAFRFSYSKMKLKATDAGVGISPERMRGFTTDINDFALIAEFNFLDYVAGSRRSTLSPYMFLGVSFFTFNPKALDGTELCNVLTDVEDYNVTRVQKPDGSYEYVSTNIIENGTAKYKKYSMSVPFGFGVKWGATSRIGLALEWRIHWALTDWIDDCHGFYPLWNQGDPWATYADPSGDIDIYGEGNQIKYLQRGDSVKFDFYSFLNITVAFKFNLPESKECNIGSPKNGYRYY